MTTAGLCGARRNSAPVKAPMKGTPASVAIGCVAAEVGVPTGPTSANTLSSSRRLRVASIERFGS